MGTKATIKSAIENLLMGSAIFAERLGAFTRTAYPRTSGTSTDTSTVWATCIRGTAHSVCLIRSTTRMLRGAMTMESKALVASRPMEYSADPPAFSCWKGRMGGTGDTARVPKRDLDRDRQVYAQPDFDNHRQHDDVHGEHRLQQQALVANQVQHAARRHLQPEGEDDQEHAPDDQRA